MVEVALAPHRSRVEAARRSVVRVLELVDQMIAASEMATEPLSEFEVGDLVRAALAWIDGGESVLLELAPSPLRSNAAKSRLTRPGRLAPTALT